MSAQYQQQEKNHTENSNNNPNLNHNEKQYHVSTTRYRIWLKQANFDLDAARIMFENKFFEWTCFQSEQSIEKALKAVLVKSGMRPPKIHRISVLISMCNRASLKFRDTKFEFRDIESFTFISRYPFLIPGEKSSPHEYITYEDAKICLDQAHQFLEKVQMLLED